MVRAARARRIRAMAVALGSVVVAAACVPPPAAQRAPTGTDHYVSLGDSWVSGPLIADVVGWPIDCARSSRNFPTQLAVRLDVASYADVSCGGAKIDDVLEEGEGVLGIPAPAQLDALRPETTLVTIGIGGNDAGISGAGIDCVNLLPFPLGPAPFGRSCVEDFVVDGVDEISGKIAEARAELTEVFAEIRRRSPRADVYVVGYGQAYADEGPTADGCWPQVPMLPPDVAYIRAKLHEMNDALADAVAEAGEGFHFVDAWALTTGHDLCQPYPNAWINGVSFEPAGIPAHPNIRYHDAMAGFLEERIRADRAAATNPPLAAAPK